MQNQPLSPLRRWQQHTNNKIIMLSPAERWQRILVIIGQTHSCPPLSSAVFKVLGRTGMSALQENDVCVFCQFLRRYTRVCKNLRFKTQAACELADGFPGRSQCDTTAVWHDLLASRVSTNTIKLWDTTCKQVVPHIVEWSTDNMSVSHQDLPEHSNSITHT